MYFNEQDFDKFWQNYESRIAINNKRIVTLHKEVLHEQVNKRDCEQQRRKCIFGEQGLG